MHCVDLYQTITNKTIEIMKTLSRMEVAQIHLNNLQLVDLTSLSESEKKAFWAIVTKEYLAQFDKLTAS
jgi:hypothetical protein